MENFYKHRERLWLKRKKTKKNLKIFEKSVDKLI